MRDERNTHVRTDELRERPWTYERQRTPSEETGMLIHCVTLKFKESTTEAEIKEFRDALAALPNQIDVPIHTRQGEDIAERPTNADYAVVTEFENKEDFYTYLKHPAHLAVPRAHVEAMHSVQFLTEEQN